MLKSLYVCENLSKRSVKWRKAINQMGDYYPGENFLGANFPPGEGIFIEPFSSYNLSILISKNIQ